MGLRLGRLSARRSTPPSSMSGVMFPFAAGIVARPVFHNNCLSGATTGPHPAQVIEDGDNHPPAGRNHRRRHQELVRATANGSELQRNGGGSDSQLRNAGTADGGSHFLGLALDQLSEIFG